MELILKRISDLPEQTAADLTGDELTIVGNNGVLQLVPISAIYANAQSQLNNVANLSVVTLADIQDKNFTDTYITYPLLSQAIQSLGLLLTPSQQQAFLEHLINYSNPHRVTAEQVGLGNVSNFPVLTESDLEANNYGNKYITYNILQAAAESLGFNDLSNVANYPPTTLAEIQAGTFGQTYLTYNLLSQAVQSLNIVLPPLLRTEFLAHLTNYDNPHETTAEQVGLGSVVNLPVLTADNIAAGDTSLEAYVTYNLLGQALGSLPNTGILTAAQKTEFLAHLTNYDNPHEVTAAQVGLGNVANLPPIAQSDINSVNGGGSPNNVYITYNMLYAANKSLGYLEGTSSSNLGVSNTLGFTEDLGLTNNISHLKNSGTTITISSDKTTVNSLNILSEINTSGLGIPNNATINFNYKLAIANNWATYSSIPFNSNNLKCNEVISGLLENTTYNFQVVINTPNSINGVNIISNIIQVDTLSTKDLDSAGSFNIVGIGGENSNPFNDVTVAGINMSIEGNKAVALLDDACCYITPIKQDPSEPPFTSFKPTISYRPKVPLDQNVTGAVAMGCIGTNLIKLIPDADPIINDGVITQTYNTVTGSGAKIQLELVNLKKGDEVVQFKGEVYN